MGPHSLKVRFGLISNPRARMISKSVTTTAVCQLQCVCRSKILNPLCVEILTPLKSDAICCEAMNLNSVRRINERDPIE